MYAMTEIVCEILPEDKPVTWWAWELQYFRKYSFRSGYVWCVMPTRNARNGMLFTANGTINIKK
jgi:queuine tRNA-ribosyltransferase